MTEQERYKKCVEWLMSEWLSEDGVFYTAQLADKAERQVRYLTGYGKGVYPSEDYLTPKEKFPWYEVEEIINLYFEGEWNE